MFPCGNYRVSEVCEGVLRIVDVLDGHAYLVMGESQALLVDTTAGYGDLAQSVAKLTELPVTVVLTHSHYDHLGGAFFFDEVLMSPLEGDRWQEEMGNAYCAYPQLVAQGVFDECVAWGPRDGVRPQVLPLEAGRVFDLGGLTVETVALPGHTPGSLGFLVRERHLLLSGDAVTPIMCLFFKESLGVEPWRKTLEAMADLPFDHFATGHHSHLFSRGDLPSFVEAAAFVAQDRGMQWQHSLLPDFKGIMHVWPYGSMDADSVDFRAVIEPWHELPRRQHRRRRRGDGETGARQ